jgi:hypothetical protein
MGRLIMWNLTSVSGARGAGERKTLFGPKLSRQRMKLLESRPLASGSVLLRYEPYAE